MSDDKISYPYYPGCSQTGTSIEYEMSVQAVCRELGVELLELNDWTCCGSTPAHTIDSHLSAALAARNLAIVKEMGGSRVATPCPSCLASLRTAEYKMRAPSFRSRVNALLDEPYEGGVEAKSMLRVLYEDIGPVRLSEKIKKNLTGLKVVPYYGCLTTRPGGIMTFDSEENPVSMDRLLEAMGAEVPDFPFKTECCGASLGVPKLEAVTRLSGRILEMAESVGADAIAVACPLCQLNLDLRRSQINSANHKKYKVPVLYITQIMGLALGLGSKTLGVEKLCVNAMDFAQKIEEGLPCA